MTEAQRLDALTATDLDQVIDRPRDRLVLTESPPQGRRETTIHLPNKATLTVPEAAKILGISRGLAYQAANSGTLPVLRVGHRMLVPRAALARLLAGDEVI